MKDKVLTRQRTVVITGGTAGVGRAVAHRFAIEGNRIGLIARDEKALEATRRELEALGAEVACVSADVANADEVFKAAELLEQRLGKIDIWVNNAMETVFATVSDMTPEEFSRVTAVTYLGCVYGVMAALRSMRPIDRGQIIQISSALAYRGIPLQSAYCGAKHAIRGFIESLRAELISEKSAITISSVVLPAANTPQFDWARARTSHTPRPMGRPVEPAVVANAVFQAALEARREYWLGLPTALIIFGNIIAPAYLDRYLGRKAIAGQQTKETVSPDRPDNLDRPITALHRTQGSFTAESANWAPLVSSEIAVVSVLMACAALVFGAGAALGGSRLWRRGSTPLPRRALHVSPTTENQLFPGN